MALRADIFEVQKSISENMTGDFDMGIHLVDELVVENDFFNQKISFEVLDQLIANTSDQEIESVIYKYMQEDKGIMNVYDLKSGELIYTTGEMPFYIPQPSWSQAKKELAPGSYRVIDSPFQATTSKAKVKLYYYYTVSKPWMFVVQRPFQEQTGPKDAAKKLVSENLNQINKYLHYELFVVDGHNKVIKASDSIMIGDTMSQVARVKNQERGIPKEQELHTFTLKNAKGEIRQYTGILSNSGEQKIVFATDVISFENEYAHILNWLRFLLVINLILGGICIHLIMKNYLYFIEADMDGGQIL